jgi:malate synthase
MKASGSLVDFGLYVFHNTQTMMQMKLHRIFTTKIRALEARWWNKVFEFAQEYLGVQMEL